MCCFARGGGAGGCVALEDGLLELSERSGPDSSSSGDDDDDDDGNSGHFGAASRYWAAEGDANCANSAGCSGQRADAKRRCVGATGAPPAQLAAVGGLAGSHVVCVPKHLWRADDLIGRKMVLF